MLDNDNEEQFKTAAAEAWSLTVLIALIEALGATIAAPVNANAAGKNSSTYFNGVIKNDDSIAALKINIVISPAYIIVCALYLCDKRGGAEFATLMQ